MHNPTHRSCDDKYRDLFINHPMPMWICDHGTGAFLEVNEEATRLYGYSVAEFLSMAITDIPLPEHLTGPNEPNGPRQQPDRLYTGIWRHRIKNGDIIDAETVSRLVDHKGRKAALVVINNITEKLRTEPQKTFDDRDKEALINSTDDMMWSVSPALRLIAANRGFHQNVIAIVGVEIQPGEHVLPEDLPEEFRNYWKDIYSRALNGELYQEELFTAGDGFRQEQWLEVRFKPIREHGDGEVTGIACYARNITERKKQEEALRLSNERYDLISKATSDLVWDVNLLTGEVYRSREGWNSLFGASASDAIATEQEWQERLHPDDRGHLAELLLDLDSHPEKTSFEFECRVLRDDGTYAFTIDRGYIIRDETGKAIRVTGATQDVTDKKEAEQRLREAEKKRTREVTQAVITGQEKERQQIGQELHDNINQVLASAKLYLGLIKGKTVCDPAISEKVDELIGTAIAEIRQLSHALVPPSLGTTKLVDAVNLLLNTMLATSTINVHRIYRGIDEKRISGKLKLAIYRIVQEQLSNIIKYAKAKNVHIQLLLSTFVLSLSIRDDGVGFDASKKNDGVGLTNIRTRASLFAASVHINSAEGKGCEINIDFPL